MVCNRCIMVVRQVIEKLGHTIESISLGEISLVETVSEKQKEAIRHQLESVGFELIDDRKSRTIEKIKNTIIQMVHYSDSNQNIHLSDAIAEALHLDYNYLSNLFSEVEGTTIEKYYIAQKIEKVKELLVYDELSLSEIAFQLNYSSVAHLSNQFKRITGLSPSHFRKIKQNKRNPLDKL